MLSESDIFEATSFKLTPHFKCELRVEQNAQHASRHFRVSTRRICCSGAKCFKRADETLIAINTKFM